MGRTQLSLAELTHAQGNRETVGRHLHAAHALFRALRIPEYVEGTAWLARAFGVDCCRKPPRTVKHQNGV